MKTYMFRYTPSKGNRTAVAIHRIYSTHTHSLSLTHTHMHSQVLKSILALRRDNSFP